ncbi:hypothetical protein [Arthrobacter rhombi]|uniref:hypothetical protein n=1 Tax=Arthrobacter rhombi TaxID=71253 RepID=UPI0031D70C37
MSAHLVAKDLSGGHAHRTLFSDLSFTVAPGDVVGVNLAICTAMLPLAMHSPRSKRTSKTSFALDVHRCNFSIVGKDCS